MHADTGFTLLLNEGFVATACAQQNLPAKRRFFVAHEGPVLVGGIAVAYRVWPENWGGKLCPDEDSFFWPASDGGSGLPMTLMSVMVGLCG